MPRLEFDVETSVPPERVIAALTDFSDRRPELWPGLNPSWYRVYSVGDTTADVREGTGGKWSPVWNREHYDWSTPGVVTWTTRDSGFCAPGAVTSARVEPKDGGGSKIRISWEREPKNLVGWFLLSYIKALKGQPVSSLIRKGLKNLERIQASSG